MTGSIGTLVDLLLFYTLERLLFNRLVGPLNQDPKLVKMVMALWLMLEQIGYYDLTRTIHSFNDQTIKAIFDESLACLECIKPDAVEPTGSDDTPILLSLFDEPMNRRFFYYNREFMQRRYTHIMATVCDRIFGERVAVEVDESGVRPTVRPFGDQGTSHEPSTTLRHKSRLNPNASEFIPGETHVETRTMFLTFSRGVPLSREEINNFFTSKWGDVVQDVVVEQAGGGQPPLYGRIIFKTAMIIPIILNGQAKAKFIVRRKHLWARIYMPRRR